MATVNPASSSYPLSFPDHPTIESFLSFANSDESLRFSDATLQVGRTRRPCHKLLLASHSSFLKALLLGHADEEDCIITLAEAEEEDVDDVLAFIYSGKVPEGAFEYGVRTLGIEVVGGEVENDVKEEEIGDDSLPSAERPRRRRIRSKWLNEDAFAMNNLVGETKVKEQEKEVLLEEKCCEMKFSSLAALKQHQETNEICKEFQPKKKRSRKSEVGEIERRRQKQNKENLECCDTQFEDEILYAAHKGKVHSEMPGRDQFIICCDEKILGTFKIHLQSIHKLDDETDQSKCCNSTFEDLSDLTKHCTSTHGLRLSTFKRVLCCATRLNSLEEYKRHKEEDSSHLECKLCTFMSKDERHLDLHLYVKHNLGNKPAKKSALTCKYCRKIFKKVHLRQDHEDKHDDKLKYTCMVCGKNFKLISSLRSHLYRMGKNHNPDAKEYNCDSCDKTFNTIIAKRKHTRVTHENKNSPTCGECEMLFVDRHSLDNHMKVMHSKIKDIQCTFCGKLFATHDRMRVHERFVHVVEEAKVPCDVCRKEFSNKERMIDHRRSVHRDRKYQCESCGSTFKNSSTLKSHVVSIHLDHDKKPLKCNICNKGFLHESRLRAHETIHSDEAPFNCQYCGRPNKCKNNNLKHERRCKKARSKNEQAAHQQVVEAEVSANIMEEPTYSAAM